MGVKTKRQRETTEERMERVERESLLSKKSMDIIKPPTTSDASQQQSDSTTDESKPLSEAEVLEKFRKLGIKI
jgi:hypothetical protein